jgi:hypothetical protein
MVTLHEERANRFPTKLCRSSHPARYPGRLSHISHFGGHISHLIQICYRGLERIRVARLPFPLPEQPEDERRVSLWPAGLRYPYSLPTEVIIDAFPEI